MRFLITAGGTREYIDPVRYISNASSGRTGYALARAAIAAGHKVTLISAPVSLRPPLGARLVPVVSAADMYKAVRRHFPACDCLIMAAAVSDYTPVTVARKKLKRYAADMTLILRPTADILKWAGYRKGRRVVVGFALEDAAVRRRAEAKRKARRADMIVANTPSAIGSQRSALYVKTASGDWLNLGRRTKASSAKKIVALVEQLAAERPRRR